jgi:putative DNA primase/helicase
LDYINFFKENHIEVNTQYPHNDIGTANLFFSLHSKNIRYVLEAKTWYVFSGKLWVKDEGGFRVMEMCKAFTQSLARFAEMVSDSTDDGKAYLKYTAGLTGRKRRESILADARSISPMSLSEFDRSKALFNCLNGTYSLTKMELLPHSPNDYISKQAQAEYLPNAVCERWEAFISEIMCGDMETARFLQKALGYCLSGGTSLECFFILYGSGTRNGKSTLIETISSIFADYARNVQPQTLSRGPNDGAAPSPDIARLKGARLVNSPEPDKGLELNTALIKQLTGGDTYTGRFLNENPIEYRPEFKIFINTNHLPRTDDTTIFTSERVKIIPFTRHFEPHEQDKSLKKLFRKPNNRSGILNWLIEGYRMLAADGLILPEKVKNAIAEYQNIGDILGNFCAETLLPETGSRLKTSIL